MATENVPVAKPIPGFPNYLAHPNGRIFNKKKGKFQTVRMINGYKSIVISHEGVSAQIYIHKLIAELYVPNPDPENFTKVRPEDGDKTNVDYTNLVWTDHSGACKAGKTGVKEDRVRKNRKVKVTH